MLHNFKAISLSFKQAPLTIREQLSLDEKMCRHFLEMLRQYIPTSDLLVLSTCNRTEVYYTADDDYSSEIIRLLGIAKHLPSVTDYLDYFTVLNVHQDAVQHLFDVAIGLEAQVVGDLQIINQVKNAYQWSADAGLAGPFLHRLLHTIFFTNKRVVQETSFREGAASVSYAAVEMVDELTAALPNPRVLVVGLGEIGTDVCRNLKDSRFTSVTVCNRTLEKAETIAQECALQVLPFENLKQGLQQADVIISSINAETPFFTAELVRHLNILSHKFFIDLSVPRSVEAQVENVPGALVYNIDTIQNKASEALERRIAAIPQVRQIINESLEQFNDWSKEMVVSPTINKLKNALEQLRQDELARYVKKLSAEENKRVDDITKSLMQKVMKLPVLQLKAACKRGEAETLIDVLNDLFDLEKHSTEVK